MPERIPHSRPTFVDGSEVAVTRVLASGEHATGCVREEFETKFASRIGVAHAHAVTSGTAALHLALLLLGAKDRRVLLPSYACGALLNAVAAAGARPVVADIDPATWTISPAAAREEVACAIVPHAFGYPADLGKFEVPVIEDCAMALGARARGRAVGAAGRAAIFSFYATKMISTGQGGMLVTDHAALSEEAADLLRYDNRERWRAAFNYGLTDLAAAMGLAQMGALDEFVAKRAGIARRYAAMCTERGWQKQAISPDTEPCFFRFIVLAPDAAGRDRWIRTLAAAGIDAKSPVFRPLHEYLGLPNRDFPVTAEIHARAVSLPIYPSLGASEQDRILAAMRELR